MVLATYCISERRSSLSAASGSFVPESHIQVCRRALRNVFICRISMRHPIKLYFGFVLSRDGIKGIVVRVLRVCVHLFSAVLTSSTMTTFPVAVDELLVY